MEVSAVIAAAGLSSRMRDFKPLMLLDGETMISRIIGSMRQADVGEIIVVAGYRGEELKKHLRLMDVRVLMNRRYAETQMLDSLKLGMASLRKPYQRLFLLPGDVPLIQPDTLRSMMAHPGQVIRPVNGGKAGHPLMVSAELVPALLDYKGPGGLKGAMAALHLKVTDLPVDDRGCTLDADTQEDLLEIHRQYSLERGGELFWPEVKISIGKGGCLFTPEDVQLLEMIAHTGSIQRACSCMHISYTRGWSRLTRLESEMNLPLTIRNPGGTDGGSTVLTDNGKLLLSSYRAYVDEMFQNSRSAFDHAFCELNALLERKLDKPR